MLPYRRLKLTVMAGFLLTTALTALANPSGDARKTIEAAYVAENRAVEKKDVKSMFVNYSSDYTQTTKKGERLTLDGIKQAVPRILLAAQKIIDKTTIQKFSMKGNKAVATVLRHTDLSIMNPQTQKPLKMIVDAVTVDTWVKSGKNWKLKLSQEKSEKQTLDGKPIG